MEGAPGIIKVVADVILVTDSGGLARASPHPDGALRVRHQQVHDLGVGSLALPENLLGKPKVVGLGMFEVLPAGALEERVETVEYPEGNDLVGIGGALVGLADLAELSPIQLVGAHRCGQGEQAHKPRPQQQGVLVRHS